MTNVCSPEFAYMFQLYNYFNVIQWVWHIMSVQRVNLVSIQISSFQCLALEIDLSCMQSCNKGPFSCHFIVIGRSIFPRMQYQVAKYFWQEVVYYLHHQDNPTMGWNFYLAWRVVYLRELNCCT